MRGLISEFLALSSDITELDFQHAFITRPLHRPRPYASPNGAKRTDGDDDLDRPDLSIFHSCFVCPNCTQSPCLLCHVYDEVGSQEGGVSQGKQNS